LGLSFLGHEILAAEHVDVVGGATVISRLVKRL
jgi:major membrane immunogen (membrane-anchored lipoprotein)